ncbi:MAG TPA: hypothetical protein VHV31_12635 [Nitrolancea sp.]|jgi:hypothetical protein|nr:hypothetical protein [Nitrolancea sp.]
MNNKRSAPSSDLDVVGNPPTNKRIWLIELIVGAVIFVGAFFINRLRPARSGAALTESPSGEPGGTYDISSQSSNPSSLAASNDYPAPPDDYEELTSIWPVVVAAGVTLTAFGVVTNVAFSILGALVFISGVIGWAGELLRE